MQVAARDPSTCPLKIIYAAWIPELPLTPLPPSGALHDRAVAASRDGDRNRSGYYSGADTVDSSVPSGAPQPEPELLPDNSQAISHEHMRSPVVSIGQCVFQERPGGFPISCLREPEIDRVAVTVDGTEQGTSTCQRSERRSYSCARWTISVGLRRGVAGRSLGRRSGPAPNSLELGTWEHRLHRMATLLCRVISGPP